MTKHTLYHKTAAASAGLILLVSIALNTPAQESGRTYPSLPGAVRRPPAWLGKDVPFDVAAFFAAPPASQNAAPLYLDALFEFSGELASCFPAGAATDARTTEGRERSQRLSPLLDAFARNPASVDRAALKAAIASFETAFQMLDDAQKRPRCVFENGIGVATLLPHVQASRQVVRV